MIRRAKERGNNENWIQTTIPFVRKSPLDDFTSEELDHVHIHYTPPKAYLTDVIKDYGWHCPQVTMSVDTLKPVRKPLRTKLEFL